MTTTGVAEEPVSGAPETDATGAWKGQRLLSLDVFRGLCVAGMLLVTDPGTYKAVYPQLLHAQWRGATAADMIFPGFLFAVGVATPLSLGGRLARGVSRGAVWLGVIRRAVLLIVLGLALNAFPAFSLHTLRLPGVLQRIAVCFLAVATIWIPMNGWSAPARLRGLLVMAIVLLFGYGALLLHVPVPGFGAGHLDTLRSLPAYVDRAVFTIPHLWPYGTTPGVGVTFDPEGLLSTLGAIVSTLLGVVIGEVLRSKRRMQARGLGVLAAYGVVLIAAGLMLDPVMPIIKKIWTPSFTLLSSGVVLLVFLGCYWLVDGRGERRGLTPLLVFGTNAIASFTVGGVITSTLIAWRISGSGAYEWLYGRLFLPWLPPWLGSLAYAIAVVAIDCLLIGVLYRRRIFLRV